MPKLQQQGGSPKPLTTEVVNAVLGAIGQLYQQYGEHPTIQDVMSDTDLGLDDVKRAVVLLLAQKRIRRI